MILRKVPALVLPFFPNTLSRWIRSVGWKAESSLLLHLAKNLAISVSQVHAQGVCHMDIKPENVLLRENISGHRPLVLADFGLAVDSNQKTFNLSGTLPVFTVF